MDVGQLCEAVQVLTARPDLVSETQLAVRSATLFFHLKDFWMRDRIEKLLPFNATLTNFQVDLPANFTNWRKFSYIRKWDGSVGEPGDYIKQMDPTAMFDEFAAKKTNVYYVSGTKLNMKTSEGQSAFLVGWYTYPNVTDQFNSWIADMLPYAIIDMAAGDILNKIGQVDEANKLIDPQKGKVFTQWIPTIYTNELEAEAR